MEKKEYKKPIALVAQCKLNTSLLETTTVGVGGSGYFDSKEIPERGIWEDGVEE